MKRRIIIFGLLLFIIALQCTQPGSQLATTGGSEVVGKLVTTADKPVNNALVYAYKITDLTPSDSTSSNANGEYTFDSLDTGSYNIYAKAKPESDSLFAFHPNIHNDIIAPKGQPPHRVPVGTDTMHAPGKIAGRVILESGDPRPIDCYIPGTSYIAKSDDSGAFVISSVPPGTYRVYYQDNSGKYQSARDSNVAVQSDQTIKLANKVLMLSTIGNPPAPTGITLLYDTASGQVTLTWNSVNVADLRQYTIMRRIDADSFITIGTVLKPQTSFIDTVYSKGTDTVDHFCTYELFSEDSTNHRSDPPAVDTITVVSPFKVGTALSISALPSINTIGDSTAINEAVTFVAEFSNKNFLVKTLYWSVGKPDSVIDSLSFPSKKGIDTLQTIFRQIGLKPVYVKAVDEKGQTKIASLIMQVVQDSPKIQFISRDTNIDFQGSFRCSVSVSHRFGSCSLFVDINHDGMSEVKRKGLTFDTVIVATINDTAWGKVSIKIHDFHGNVIDTGFMVTVGAAPLHGWSSGPSMNNARRWHSSCVVNNKLYVIGGFKFNFATNKPKSLNSVEAYDSIWTSCDTLITPRYDFVTGVYNNSIYVFGGIGGKNGTTNSIERYDPAQNKWTTVGSMQFMRTKAASCVLGDKLYLFGGCVPMGENDSVCSSIYSYDFSTNNWTELPYHMKKPRFHFQAALSNGQIYLIGGYGGADDVDGGKALSDVEIFDPASGQCQTGPALPAPRYDFASVSINDTVYVIGGVDASDITLYNDVVMMTPSSTIWKKKTVFPDPNPEGRSAISAGVLNGKMIITGGGSTYNQSDPTYVETLVRKYYP